MGLTAALFLALCIPGQVAAAHEYKENPGGLRSSSGRNNHRVAIGTNDVTTDRYWNRYWAAPIQNVGPKCIDNSIRAGGDKPLSTCIREGEALCIEYNHQYSGGRWTFGIKDSMLKLWNPKMEVVWEFCTEITHVCIGEAHEYDPNRFSKERPYLNFYNEKTNQIVGSLTCDGTDGKVSTTIAWVSTNCLHCRQYIMKEFLVFSLLMQHNV